MSGDLAVGQSGVVAAATAAVTPQAPARPQATLTAEAPKPAGDAATVSKRSVNTVASLSLVSEGPSLTSFFQGFHAGQVLDLGAEGFFGSSFVGGTATMTTLKADRFSLALDVKAPGNDRKDTMSFTRTGDDYVSKDNAHFKATFSNNNKTMTLTNATNSKQKLVLTVPKAGHFTFTSFGFEPKADGKTMTATAK
jgi:hypothetical protein